MADKDPRVMSPLHSSDFYGDRQRARESERVRLGSERDKIVGDMQDGNRSATPGEQKQLDEIETERQRLLDEEDRDERERNSGLNGEELDELARLERESQNGPLNPEDTKELERLKNAVDSAPADPAPVDLDPDPPSPGNTDNGRDLAGPDDDLGRALGGSSLGDRDGVIPGPGPTGPQDSLTPGDLERHFDGTTPMEGSTFGPGFDPVIGGNNGIPGPGGSDPGSGEGGQEDPGNDDRGGGTGSGGSGEGGQGGSGSAGDSGGSGGQGGDPGGGDAGGGGGPESRGLSEGPDSATGRRTIPRLGRDHLSLNEVARRRLGNVINPLGDAASSPAGHRPTGDGPLGPSGDQQPQQPGGRVVGDPDPDDGNGLRIPSAEARERVRRPGSDPRITDPPEGDDV